MEGSKEYVVPALEKQVLRLLQNGCMDMMQPMKTLIRSQMILQYRKQICSLQ